MSPSNAARIDFSVVQGLLVRPYTHPVSCHLLARFDGPPAARAFLKALVPSLTSALPWPEDQKPQRLMNIALSYKGLEAAGALSPAALACLPGDFQQLPSAAALGDVGSGPLWWNNQRAEDFHCLVSLWADTPATLSAFIADVEHEAKAGTTLLKVRPDGDHIRGALFTQMRQLHFGYNDGISSPDIDWADTGSAAKVNYRHYLLGRGIAGDPTSSDPLSGQGAERDEAARFIRDGMFLVFRVMHQDVAGFNQFLESNARLLAPILEWSEADTANWLAAKMLGRWRTGESLVLDPEGLNPADALRNDFDYDKDPVGESCPPSAHIRVVNPRSEPIDDSDLPVPRLLRRGMPYGDPLTGTVDDGKERGLIGMFLCNSPRAQFEKLMSWIKRNDFSDVFKGNRRAQDALLGNREVDGASKEFRIPTKSKGVLTAKGLTTFVRARGTAYFLLPSLPALRRLAGAE